MLIPKYIMTVTVNYLYNYKSMQHFFLLHDSPLFSALFGTLVFPRVLDASHFSDWFILKDPARKLWITLLHYGKIVNDLLIVCCSKLNNIYKNITQSWVHD